MRVLGLFTLLVLSACLEIPEGHIACVDDDGCPGSMVCSLGLCAKAKVTEGEPRWRCHDEARTSIFRSAVCDGEIDCPDGSDERRCDRFACGTIEIASNFLCDGVVDCEGEEDELDCEPIACADETVPFVFARWLCDGVQDCPGGEDEGRSSIAQCFPSFVCNATLPPLSRKLCVAYLGDGTSEASSAAHCAAWNGALSEGTCAIERSLGTCEEDLGAGAVARTEYDVKWDREEARADCEGRDGRFELGPDAHCVGTNGQRVDRGETETRVRYLEESVPYAHSCEAEEQERVCDAYGEFSAWSGSFTFEHCEVLPGSCKGTAKACSQMGSACTSQQGCQERPRGCRHTTTQNLPIYSCGQLDGTACWSHWSCTPCVGCTPPCEGASNVRCEDAATEYGQCTSYIGLGYACTWDTNPICIGAAKACSTFTDEASCLAQTGCVFE